MSVGSRLWHAENFDAFIGASIPNSDSSIPGTCEDFISVLVSISFTNMIEPPTRRIEHNKHYLCDLEDILQLHGLEPNEYEAVFLLSKSLSSLDSTVLYPARGHRPGMSYLETNLIVEQDYTPLRTHFAKCGKLLQWHSIAVIPILLSLMTEHRDGT